MILFGNAGGGSQGDEGNILKRVFSDYFPSTVSNCCDGTYEFDVSIAAVMTFPGEKFWGSQYPTGGFRFRSRGIARMGDKD